MSVIILTMEKHRFIPQKNYDFMDEDREWLMLTPAKRILETTKLWRIYFSLGGSLDPEPDPQSPFYFQEI